MAVRFPRPTSVQNSATPLPYIHGQVDMPHITTYFCNEFNSRLIISETPGARLLRAPQNPDSPLLNLPNELLLFILGELLVVDQVMLPLTCRHLYSNLESLRTKASKLCIESYLEYLTRVAHDLPDHWVCELCAKLHPIRMSDTPANPFISGCPKAKKAAKPTSPDVGWTVALPHHRHVQLALKHTRLGKRSPYLENISEPGPLICPKREALYPKIVNGRYLVLYTWARTKNPGSLYQKDLEVLRACKHQCCWSSDKKKLEPLNPFHNFERTVNTALKEVGREVLGTCHRCATDFSVRVDYSVMTVWIWKDLGTEGSPLEPAWRRLTGDYRLPSEASSSEHKPGDIRALYTQTRSDGVSSVT